MSGVMLCEFGPSIWTSRGPIISFLGFRYPTRMAVIRLPNGGLFVWSPVALSTSLKKNVDALGSVRFLVSPNRLHHLYLSEWNSAYPSAKLCAPPGLRAKRKDLAFDRDLSDTPKEWSAEIDQVPVRGSILTEVVFFHRESRPQYLPILYRTFRPVGLAAGGASSHGSTAYARQIQVLLENGESLSSIVARRAPRFMPFSLGRSSAC